MHTAQICNDETAYLLDFLDTAGFDDQLTPMREHVRLHVDSCTFPSVVFTNSLQYIAAARGFFIVYSISSKESWEEAIKIYKVIVEARKNTAAIVFVENKIDLEKERAVSREEAQRFAAERGCLWTAQRYDIA